MKRRWFGIMGVSAAVLTLLGGAAYAGRGHCGGSPERMKARVMDHIEEALEDRPLSPQQKQAVESLIDRTAEAFKQHRADKREVRDQALALFAAADLDEAKVKALRDEQLQRLTKIGDVVASALAELHDVLDDKQRQALADEVRSFTDRFHP